MALPKLSFPGTVNDISTQKNDMGLNIPPYFSSKL